MATAAAALITGCATNRDPVPHCQVPPLPNPPELSGEELAPLSDEVYWKLRERDDAWQSSLLEHRAILREVCD